MLLPFQVNSSKFISRKLAPNLCFIYTPQTLLAQSTTVVIIIIIMSPL